MSSTSPSTLVGEPQVRGTAFFGLRAAVSEIWGAAGVRSTEGQLDDEVRAFFAQPILTPQAWLPERHLLASCEGIWAGPAQREDGAFRACVARSVFHGWGRFQRLLLSYVSASALAARAPALWRRDHTHGELDLRVGEGDATIWLTDSPYGESEFSRLLIAETFRSIVAMTRVAAGAQVREAHGIDPGRRVVIQLSWEGEASAR